MRHYLNHDIEPVLASPEDWVTARRRRKSIDYDSRGPTGRASISFLVEDVLEALNEGEKDAGATAWSTTIDPQFKSSGPRPDCTA
jgi:hypothetical protein